MDRNEHLLTIAAEECAEIAQRLTKALRFGIDEVQPGQTLSNRERLVQELADLQGALVMLEEAGLIVYPSPQNWRAMIYVKQEKIEKFLEYSKTVGTLT
jgi:hypothetical protein